MEQVCSKCKKSKELNSAHFKAKGMGGYSKVCKPCLENISHKNAEKRRDAKEADKDNRADMSDGTEDDDTDASLAVNLTELELDVFLESIASNENLHSFAALVNLSEISETARDAKAKELSRLVWEHSKYRFM